MRPELKFTRQERNQRERRARRQADHMATSTIAAAVSAIGAGEISDWLDDATEHHKPARREQRGVEG